MSSPVNAFTALKSRLEEVKNKPDHKVRIKKGEFLDTKGRSILDNPYRLNQFLPPRQEDKELAFQQYQKKVRTEI